MERTFDLDGTLTRILPPTQEVVRWWEGDAAHEHACEDHGAAIAYYLARVEALLNEGAVELMPWVRWTAGERALEVRPPTTPTLSYVLDDERVDETFDTLLDALLAYNRFIDARFEEGFRHHQRRWEDLSPPGEPYVEGRDETRRFYAHAEDSERELGPEFHLFDDGTPHHDLLQVDTMREGPRRIYKDEDGQRWLSILDIQHRDTQRGAYFGFDARGRITYHDTQGRERIERVFIFRDGALHVEGLGGKDAQGNRRGVWKEVQEDSIATLSYEDGDVRWVEWHTREGGLLEQRVDYGDDPHRIKTIYYDDGETVSRRYGLDEEGNFRGSFEVYYDTGELAKRFTFADALAPLPGERRELEYVPVMQAARRGEPTRRLVIPEDGELTWWEGEHQHTRSHERQWEAGLTAVNLATSWARMDHFIPEGPWVTWSNGEERVRARLPVAEALITASQGGDTWREETEQHDSHLEAILAYNAWVEARQAEGYALEVPPEHQGWPRPGDDFALFEYTPRDDEDGMTRRWVHIRSDDLAEELRFGPQREEFDDGMIIDCFYASDRELGWRLTYEQGAMTAAHALAGGAPMGRLFSLDARSQIEISVLRFDDVELETASLQGDQPIYHRHYDEGAEDQPLEDGRVLDALEPIDALFVCLERFEYVPTPVPDSQYTDLYDDTTAARVNLPETLEDHLARLHCIAHADLSQLEPAKVRGAWTHRSEAGSELKLSRRSGRLTGAKLTRADGTLAAEATYRKGTGYYDDPHVDVTLYHDDGVTPQRWGGYKASFPWNDEENLHCRRDGWWFDRDMQGRTRRAQHFSSGTYNLSADHRFDDAFYDLSDEHPAQSFDELFGEARSLANGEASREHFLKICELVAAAATRDPGRVNHELAPYLTEALASWPARLRMAPWLWINRLVTGALPVEALGFVSALSLTAAVSEHFLSSRYYPLLLAWLATYPEDGPAPEGISMSFRRDVAQALEQARAAEPHERYHPGGDLDLDETFFTDSDDHELIFGSPLMRNVRVLDLSWEPTSHDFYWDYQGILDGRGLRAGDVARWLPSTRLEVLDLWGQSREPRDQFSRGSVNKAAREALAGLEVLNVGGGHPLGDSAVKALAKACPNLRQLSLRPGQAGDLLHGYDFDEWEEGSGRDSVYGRIYEHWSVYGNDDIDKMRMSRDGWRALAKLPLERVTLGDVQADHAFGDEVEVEVLSQYGWSDSPRIAAWESHFDA